MSLDPLERLSERIVTVELTIGDVVMAALSAQICGQLSQERAGDVIGAAFFKELSDRLYAFAGSSGTDAGLSVDELREVVDELKAQARIFTQPNH